METTSKAVVSGGLPCQKLFMIVCKHNGMFTQSIISEIITTSELFLTYVLFYVLGVTHLRAVRKTTLTGGP